MTADDFRDLLLDFEGVVEGAHMGHPDFRLQGRIFASLMADGLRANVKLAPEEQAAFVDEAPVTFTPAAGAWGRQGWTAIQLPAAKDSAVRGACVLAWQAALAAPPRKPPRRRTSSARR
ncbi:hypothetical protein LuPra_00327 [Luteitalea pratensis]|uniref:MmcQ/YjbR family DNA-binding protein n=1 Tax=Luteitalea pratensis TaxID=1855912 RepID=A0A143PFV2_LUTPR|nr:MmcQ/YjbR family DNA-binding protein [Luteitalea pratensis]AMY07160.1 hypothetical protein LuPra_00327 [Luteitalea pratensis]